jgi:hypothetical protein
VDGPNPTSYGGVAVNLVQEAMASERGTSKKKRAPKDGRKRMVTTLFTWILLNVIWTGALGGESLNEVMDHDSRFIGNYYLDVPDMLKLNHTVPTYVECDYRARNDTGPQHVRLIHQSPNGDTETLWEGVTGVDECPSIMLELEPGGHNFITQVIEIDGVRNQTPSKLVSSELDLAMKVYEPIHTEGYIVANVLGICLFVGERGVRAMLKRRNASNVRDMPLHKLRQKEEWESIVESMSGGDAADVEDLIPFTSTEDSAAEKRRQKMRDDFAAQAATTDDDVEDFTDDSEVKDDDELGEGTTEGLEGEVKPDPRLRTVKDIWERIEEDDD